MMSTWCRQERRKRWEAPANPCTPNPPSLQQEKRTLRKANEVPMVDICAPEQLPQQYKLRSGQRMSCVTRARTISSSSTNQRLRARTPFGQEKTRALSNQEAPTLPEDENDKKWSSAVVGCARRRSAMTTERNQSYHLLRTLVNEGLWCLEASTSPKRCAQSLRGSRNSRRQFKSKSSKHVRSNAQKPVLTNNTGKTLGD